MVRNSLRPSKHFLWHLFSRDIEHSQGFEIGLDLACGKMGNRHLFKTNEYIGVDIDESRLNEGVSKYPEAQAISSSLENLPVQVKGDFVVCLQTIGFNTLFDDAQTLRCVENITRSVRAGGTLIFNVGYGALQEFEKTIDTIVNCSFEAHHKTIYGRFSNPCSSFYVSSLLASCMRMCPPLRYSRAHRCSYYLCSARLPS